MNQQVVIWTSVIIMMAVLLVLRTAGKTRIWQHNRKRRPVIEIGKESEMFYCPGDKIDNDDATK